MRNGNLLSEVVIIRPILILSIVIGHSFAIYSGSWSIPEYIDSIDWYKYINPLFINFQLPAFVFISGYLFEAKRHKVFEEGFVLKKFRRLMIPALIFSIIYYFLFKFDKNNEISLVQSLIRILSGEGHLWFLPMLFWCFVSVWVFRNFNINSKILFVVLSVLSLLPFPIPFGIGSMLHYIIYFYLGNLVWKNRDTILSKMNYKWIFGIVAIYIIFLLMYLNRDSLAIITENTFLMKSVNYLIEGVIRYFVNITGIFLLYLIVIQIVNSKRGCQT